MTITQLIVCIVAGLGAGLGTGLAGLSAAAVVSPMLITFLHMPAYQAIGIALASDVLASGVSAWTYKKNKNIDIRHGVIMLISVLIFTLVGSFVSSLVPNGTMGGFSKVMTLFVGLKFIIRPIMTTKEVQANKSEKQKIQQSILCGVVIGFICGFVGAGGGMMLLLVLTSVLGYELKTAVGTSVFIMTNTYSQIDKERQVRLPPFSGNTLRRLPKASQLLRLYPVQEYRKSNPWLNHH